MCASVIGTDSEWRQYSQDGNIVQSEWRNYTIHSQNGKRFTDWRHYTVRMETLYSQNGNDTNWRHYTVRMERLYRLETLYSQSGDTIQSIWRHYKITGLYPGHWSLICLPLRLYNNSEYHKWHTDTLCGQNAKSWKVKTHAVNTFLFKFKMPVMRATNEPHTSN